MTTGVVAGKFHPFHLGHQHLIDTALEHVDELDVVVCEAAGEMVPGATRAAWIDETHRGRPVRTHVFDWTGLDPDDSVLWARITLEVIGRRPDACFTSEAYGASWAAAMGCTHVSVDPARAAVPVSGSQIRADVLGHLGLLPPATRASFCRRVCVMGAESTGKTTLAHDLAQALETCWVPEYGRLYCEAMPDPRKHVWNTADFAHIVSEQHRLEDDAARRANRVLVCDTDAFTTCVFHDMYLGAPAPDSLRAQVRHYDLYVVTDPATPFEQDATGLRDPDARARMHQAYLTMLAETNARHVAVSGTPQQRREQALDAVAELMRVPVVLHG